VTQGIPIRLFLYALIALLAIIAFTVYRYVEGLYWLSGFFFITHDTFTVVCFTIILISEFKIASLVWKAARSFTQALPTWASKISSATGVLIALYGFSISSMIVSLKVVKILNIDPLQGYVP
jgi:hypothetical protein